MAHTYISTFISVSAPLALALQLWAPAASAFQSPALSAQLKMGADSCFRRVAGCNVATSDSFLLSSRKSLGTEGLRHWGASSWWPASVRGVRRGRMGLGGLRAKEEPFEDLSIGDELEAKWEGEWWPVTVQDIKKPENKIKAVRVRFQGSAEEEEWIEAKQGNLRRTATLERDGSLVDEFGNARSPVYSPEEKVRNEEALTDYKFWKSVGKKSTGLDSIFADILKRIIRTRVRPGSRILDLAAGAKTQLPKEFAGFTFGVGIVPEHLEVNKQLDDWAEIDLNDPDCSVPLDDKTFDAVLLNAGIQYMKDPLAVLKEARRVLKEDGLLICSWSSFSEAAKIPAGWSDRTGNEQIELLKQIFFEDLKLDPGSLRIDVSGPTDGDKLYVLSASPTCPKVSKEAEKKKELESINPQMLKYTLKDKKRSRKDSQRQQEQDAKPFRVRVVSPPPETMLEGVYKFPPRTHNGDKVEVGGSKYVVSKVQYLYSYRQGRYRLDEKVLEVQKQTRYDVNQQLNNLLPQEK